MNYYELIYIKYSFVETKLKKSYINVKLLNKSNEQLN